MTVPAAVPSVAHSCVRLMPSSARNSVRPATGKKYVTDAEDGGTDPPAPTLISFTKVVPPGVPSDRQSSEPFPRPPSAKKKSTPFDTPRRWGLELAELARILTASTVPATVPSDFHSSRPLDTSAPEKYTVPSKLTSSSALNRKLGSACRIDVPASVPSDFHS